MAKKIIVPVIITALVFFLLVSQSFNVLSISSVSSDDIIDSSFIAKAGFVSELESTNSDSAFFSELINKGYGYILLDTPVKLNSQFKSQIKRVMSEFNEEAQDLFGKPIYTSNLFTLLDKTELNFNDLLQVNKELTTSLNNFCKLIEENKDSNRLGNNRETRSLIEFCNGLNGDIFVKKGFAYELNLPDINLYKPIYTSQECTQTPNGNTICQIPEQTGLTSDGKIELSKLNVQIYERGGTIFIAINSKAVEELDKLPQVFDFEQLGFYVEHQDSITDDEFNKLEKGGYWIFSNNQNVVKASNGEIEKRSKFSDFYYGIKSGRILQSTRSQVNVGLVFLISVGSGGLSYYLLNRKKNKNSIF